MAKILQFKSDIKFAPDIIKYQDDKGKWQQDIIIVLRKENIPYPIISIATCMIKPWTQYKSKSSYEYARRICEFLNYVYFECRPTITRFEEINQDHIIKYINSLNTTNTREYIKKTLSTLKKSFYYLAIYFPNRCQITTDQFIIEQEKNKLSLTMPKVETEIVLPSAHKNKKPRMKLNTINYNIIFQFLNLAKIEAPNCVMGFYLQFFGGLRASEALHLTIGDMPVKFQKNGTFKVFIRDKILNPDGKYSDLNQNKRERKQPVLIAPGLFEDIKQIYLNNRNQANTVVFNKDNMPMTDAGYRDRFNKIKTILIEQLRETNKPENMTLAFTLEHFSWSTHIGRKFYSNLIAEVSNNPYLVSVMRGDSSFGSALPYLAESERTNQQITQILEKMYSDSKEE